MKSALFVLSLTVLATVNANSSWSYEGSTGPDYWPSVSATCGASSQSPIDIQTSGISKNTKLTGIQFIDYNHYYSGFKLTNNGHTVQINVNTDKLRVKGSDFSSEYALEQFHFHWGPDDHEGSEHLVNSHPYPMEIHLVHHKTMYPDVNTALNYDEGVAVIGFFAELTTHEANPAVDRLIKYFSKVPYEGNSLTMDPFNVYDLLPKNTNSYYRYKGSLTTPPCTEGLVWTVFHEPIKVTSAQLEQFRHLHQETVDEDITENHRPTQPLNGRIVYKSF